MFKKTLLGTAIAFSVLAPFASTAIYAAAPSATVKDAISDTVITGKIKGLFAKSSLLKDQQFSVTTTNQRVVLAGQVMTNKQYERAIILAESVKGVKRVNVDNLTVKSSDAPLADAYITAKVKSRFIQEKLFGSKSVSVWPVKVETKDAVVFLTGKVANATERKNIVRLAHKIKGVKSVKSSITLG